jgi:hypothetical protein
LIVCKMSMFVHSSRRGVIEVQVVEYSSGV